MYKMITSIITNKTEKHMVKKNIQNRCRKQSQGRKEQLIIDSVAMKETEKQQINLITCYID